MAPPVHRPAPAPAATRRPVERGERHERLRAMLRAAERPLPGGDLATALGVSRQVIVQDVAVLRAAGEAIVATPRGYVSARTFAPLRLQEVVAVRHGPQDVADELLALVEAGVRVLDVVVEHPLYGELRGTLWLESRSDVQDWLQRAAQVHAHLLSELTDGLHLHTLEAARPETLARARDALRRRGFLAEACP